MLKIAIIKLMIIMKISNVLIHMLIVIINITM